MDQIAISRNSDEKHGIKPSKIVFFWENRPWPQILYVDTLYLYIKKKKNVFILQTRLHKKLFWMYSYIRTQHDTMRFNTIETIDRLVENSLAVKE